MKEHPTLSLSVSFPLPQPATGNGQRATPRRGRAAFTLIEMLVVMAIIGLLAGLVFPTVTAVRTKAYATQTHEMVNQMQNAWKIHMNEFRSFPESSLFEKVTKDGGDIIIPMSPHNLCILNWRCPRPTDYAGSTDAWMGAFRKTVETAVAAKTDNKPHSAKVSGKSKTDGKNKDFSIATRDSFFEINQIQWICGVLNTWGERKAQVLFKQGGVEAAATAPDVLQKEKFADPRVFVKLDGDGDGKVAAPVTTSTSTADTLNMVAVSWVGGASPKDDAIVSW